MAVGYEWSNGTLGLEGKSGGHETAAVSNSTPSSADSLNSVLDGVSTAVDSMGGQIGLLSAKSAVPVKWEPGSFAAAGKRNRISAASAFFGYVKYNTGSDLVIIIDNKNTLPVNYDGMEGLAAPFSFKDGSFPGTGGTCTASLPDKCTIVLSFASGQEVADNGYVIHAESVVMDYDVAGAAASTSKILLIADSVSPPQVGMYDSAPADSLKTGYGETDTVTAYIKADKSFGGGIGADYAVNMATDGLTPPFYLAGGGTPSCSTVTDDIGLTQTLACTLDIIYRPTVPSDNDTVNLTAQFKIPDANPPIVTKTLVLSRRAAPVFDFNSPTPAGNVLIVYNKDSSDSAALESYYVANRPGFASANVLGIDFDPRKTGNCPAVTCPDPDSEITSAADYETEIADPITGWIGGHSDKNIDYIVLMAGIPTTVFDFPGQPDHNGSVDNDIHRVTGAMVTRVDMGSAEATKAYIDKIAAAYAAAPAGSKSLFVSGLAAGKAGNAYYIEDLCGGYGLVTCGHNGLGYQADQTLETQGAEVDYRSLGGGDRVYTGTDAMNNVAGFYTWGVHSGDGYGGGHGPDYPFVLKFSGNSGWYLIDTSESFNGQRNGAGGMQGHYTQWFSKNAFGGSDYENTPIGAVGYVQEPDGEQVSLSGYFGCWNAGAPFAVCANGKYNSIYTVAYGDPWVVR